MPNLDIEIFSGRSVDQKRDLVRRLTDAVVESLAVTPESVRVRIVEVEKDNLANAGILKADAEAR